MTRTRRPRTVRTWAVGTLVTAGVVGAALLADPLASSQADNGRQSGTYYNGGFCYQNKVGEPNTYRLRVFETSNNPDAAYADLSYMVEKWDDSSNQYHDERLAFTNAVDKMSLGGYYQDANVFCEAMTADRAGRYLGGDVYRYGEWTSTRTIG